MPNRRSKRQAEIGNGWQFLGMILLGVAIGAPLSLIHLTQPDPSDPEPAVHQAALKVAVESNETRQIRTDALTLLPESIIQPGRGIGGLRLGTPLTDDALPGSVTASEAFGDSAIHRVTRDDITLTISTAGPRQEITAIDVTAGDCAEIEVDQPRGRRLPTTGDAITLGSHLTRVVHRYGAPLNGDIRTYVPGPLTLPRTLEYDGMTLSFCQETGLVRGIRIIGPSAPAGDAMETPADATVVAALHTAGADSLPQPIAATAPLAPELPAARADLTPVAGRSTAPPAMALAPDAGPVPQADVLDASVLANLPRVRELQSTVDLPEPNWGGHTPQISAIATPGTATDTRPLIVERQTSGAHVAREVAELTSRGTADAGSAAPTPQPATPAHGTQFAELQAPVANPPATASRESSGQIMTGLAVFPELAANSARLPGSAGALQAPEAEEQLGLTRRQRRELQRRLVLLGHDTGGVDGIFGAKSRAAIAAAQQATGLPASGYIDPESLDAIRDATEDKFARWRAAIAARRTAERENMANSQERRTGKSGKCARNADGKIAENQGISCDWDMLGESLGELFGPSS